MTKLRNGRLPIVILGLILGLAVRADAGAPPGQYNVMSDTVQDTKTGLLWQHDVPATPCAGSATCTQAQAGAYCQGLTLDGFPYGWRLPTVKELQTIVDERAFGPAIDTSAFPATPAEFFWSSSPYVYLASNAWAVHFNNGRAYYFDTSSSYRVRCVH